MMHIEKQQLAFVYLIKLKYLRRVLKQFSISNFYCCFSRRVYYISVNAKAKQETLVFWKMFKDFFHRFFDR